jgi:hypothetical protein
MADDFGTETNENHSPLLLNNYSPEKIGGWDGYRACSEVLRQTYRKMVEIDEPENFAFLRRRLNAAELMVKIFTIHEVAMEVLGHEPERMVELATGGDVSAAMAFPRTEVITVNDHRVGFVNLPTEITDRKKSVWSFLHPRDDCADFKALFPNWRELLGNAAETSLPTGQYEMILIQNWPRVGGEKFGAEMTRLCKPGGIIVSSNVREGVGEGRFYIDEQLIQRDGLEPVLLDDKFRHEGGVDLQVWRKKR